MIRFLPWISCLAALTLAPGLSSGAEYKLADLTNEKLVERLTKYLAIGDNQTVWNKILTDKTIAGTVNPKDIKGAKSPFEWTFIVNRPLTAEQAKDLKAILSDFFKEATVQYDPDQKGGLLTIEDHATLVAALTLTTKETPPPNTPPTIALTAASFAVEAGKDGNFEFTIGDKETPADKLKVSVKSNDETKIPAASVKLTGTDAKRSGTVPAPKFTGDFEITITVADDVGATATATLALKITAVPTPANSTPTIVVVPTGLKVVAGSDAKFEIAIDDKETPAEKLKVAVKSDNEAVFAATAVRIAGSGKLRQGSLSIPTVAGGEYRLIFTVTDESGKSAAATLILTASKITDPVREPSTTNVTSCGCGLTMPIYESYSVCCTPCSGPIRRLFRSPCWFDRTPALRFLTVPTEQGYCGSASSAIASPELAPANWTAIARTWPTPAPVNIVNVTCRELLAVPDPEERAKFFEKGLRQYWAGSTAQAVEYFAAVSAASDEASLWIFFALALIAEGRTADARDAAQYAAALQVLNPNERVAVLESTERVQGQKRRALAELAADIADATKAVKFVQDHRKKLEFEAAKEFRLANVR